MRILLSLATAATILAIALLLLMTPFWMHFALDASGSSGPAEVSDRTVSELFFGPGTFDFAIQCDDLGSCARSTFYTPDEAAHMRDVRVVLLGFLALALASLGFVVAMVARAPRDAVRWRAISRGGEGLVVGLIAVGTFALVAFDAAFTLFHEIFFPGGNWAFPAQSNLIRLYPEPFWELTTAALGILAGAGGVLVWFLGRRRVAALEAI